MPRSLKKVVICSLTFFVLTLTFIVPMNIWAVEPKAGDIIDSTNVEQYKEYFPMFIERYVKDGWGFEKPVVIKVRAPEFVPFTKNFLEISKKNMTTCKLTADGMIDGYPGQ